MDVIFRLYGNGKFESAPIVLIKSTLSLIPLARFKNLAPFCVRTTPVFFLSNIANPSSDSNAFKEVLKFGWVSNKFLAAFEIEPTFAISNT